MATHMMHLMLTIISCRAIDGSGGLFLRGAVSRKRRDVSRKRKKKMPVFLKTRPRSGTASFLWHSLGYAVTRPAQIQRDGKCRSLFDGESDKNSVAIFSLL